jgi:EAL domain-containing protein (putative c-di-GMP-specific phosphodiesterase class I)
VSEKLLQCLGAVYDLNGREIFLTASIGIAVYPNDGASADALIQAADSAMDRSKDQGGNCCQYFAEELDERVRSQLFLEQELHHAIDRQQLYLEYQPQWSLETGRLVGVEALLRWRHPELGVVSPATFIPIAESTGLIVAIGALVLKEACRQLRHWDQHLDHPLRMAVNVSPRQFQSTTLEADVREAIAEAGIHPERLELEITESMMARNFPDVVASLHGLKRLGVSISIDDFGTGYSSLSYLADFPVDTLKIDQSFVRGVDQQPGCRAIISSVLTLVRGLDLRVIAEGIETESQLSFLRDLGCDEGQGFLMGRPMSADALIRIAAESGGHG